jgi:hypothetical protein
MNVDAVRKALARLTDAEGVPALAERIGVVPEAVYMVLRGTRPPGRAILAALGLEREPPRYRRVGGKKP